MPVGQTFGPLRRFVIPAGSKRKSNSPGFQEALDDSRHAVEVDFAAVYGTILQADFDDALEEAPIEIASDFQVW